MHDVIQEEIPPPIRNYFFSQPNRVLQCLYPPLEALYQGITSQKGNQPYRTQVGPAHESQLLRILKLTCIGPVNARSRISQLLVSPENNTCGHIYIKDVTQNPVFLNAHLYGQNLMFFIYNLRQEIFIRSHPNSANFLFYQ